MNLEEYAIEKLDEKFINNKFTNLKLWMKVGKNKKK